MDPRPIFQTETDFHVSYDPDIECVYMTWRGYHTSALFRSENEQVLSVITRHRARKMLTDIRYFVLIGASDQEWLNSYWLPRAFEAGLRTCAIVAPVFYFNRVAVQGVVERMEPNALKVEYFDSPEMARRWLLSLP
jgi:hypothetical protein